MNKARRSRSKQRRPKRLRSQNSRCATSPAPAGLHLPSEFSVLCRNLVRRRRAHVPSFAGTTFRAKLTIPRISPAIGLHSGRMAEGLLAILLTRIVVRIQVFEAQRTDRRYLGDVLTGFCPMEVGRIAGQNNDAAGWIRFDLVA